MSLTVGYQEGADGMDLIGAESTGPTKHEAHARARAAAIAEASSMRKAQVQTILESRYDNSGADEFESWTRLESTASLQGSREVDWEAEPLADGTWRARVVIAVPREQVLPTETLDDIEVRVGERTDRARIGIENFIARAEHRGDHEAAAEGYQRLLRLDYRPEDVVHLAAQLERGGHVPLAVSTLDEWIGTTTTPDPRWISARETAALKLPDPAEVVDRMLRAARGVPRPDLDLHVARDRVDLATGQVIRGEVPAGQDLLLVWCDAEVIQFWQILTASDEQVARGRLEKTLDYQDPETGRPDPTGYVPGDVHLVVVSGPGLAATVDPAGRIDLAAAARDDLLALEELAEARSVVDAWAQDGAIQMQVLSWVQEDHDG